MPSKHIEQLRDLTLRLPAFPETDYASHGFRRHVMECGTSLSWDLDPHASTKAGVAKWFNSKGTCFQEHVHESREWIIVLEGSMLLTVGGQKESRLLPGMSATIEPGTVHRAVFIEDCWYYAITIPRDENWPAG